MRIHLTRPSRFVALAGVVIASVGVAAPPAAALTGGRALAKGEVPSWVARIYVSGQPACTGSLIGTSIVLTAAHCVTDQAGAPLAAPRVTVSLGQARDQRRALRRSVTEVRVPTEFSPDHYGGDIALLLLAAPIPVEKVASIAPPWQIASAGAVKLYGYGPTRLQPTDAGQSFGIVRVAPTTLTPRDICLGDSYIAPEWSDPHMRCLGEPGSRVAPCPQDSGGPVVSGGGVVGVMSFSPNAACQSRIATVPSVIARIDCGPQRAFVNRSFRRVLHVLSDAETGPELTLDDPDGFEVFDRRDRDLGEFSLTSFYPDADVEGDGFSLNVPGRPEPVPVTVRGRVEVRVGVVVSMPEGCPQLPAL